MSVKERLLSRSTGLSLDNVGEEVVGAFDAYLVAQNIKDAKDEDLHVHFKEFLKGDGMLVNLQDLRIRVAADALSSHLQSFVAAAPSESTSTTVPTAAAAKSTESADRSFSREEVAQLLALERAKNAPAAQDHPQTSPGPSLIEGAINALVASPATLIKATYEAARDIASDLKKKPAADAGVGFRKISQEERSASVDQDLEAVAKAAKLVSGLKRSSSASERHIAVDGLTDAVAKFVGSARAETHSGLTQVKENRTDGATVQKIAENRSKQLESILSKTAESPGANGHSDVKEEVLEIKQAAAKELAEMIKRVMNMIKAFFVKPKSAPHPHPA